MKMFRFILVLLGLSTMSIAFGQDGVYRHPEFQDDNQCDLFLEVCNGKYHLFLSYELSLDYLTGTTLSIGDSREDGTMIVLTDELFGYTMVMERRDTTVFVMSQGFSSMVGLVFDYLPLPTSSPFVYNSDTRDFNRDPHRVKQENCKARHERKVEFQIGSYALGDEKEYLLNIKENGRFDYFYHGVKISEGSWKRYRNLLALTDDGMGKPFYAIIKENGIISSYIPGAFVDSVWEYE